MVGGERIAKRCYLIRYTYSDMKAACGACGHPMCGQGRHRGAKRVRKTLPKHTADLPVGTCGGSCFGRVESNCKQQHARVSGMRQMRLAYTGK